MSSDWKLTQNHVGRLTVVALETEFFYMHYPIVPDMGKRILQMVNTLQMIPPAYYFKSAFFDDSRVAQYKAKNLVAGLRLCGKIVWVWQTEGVMSQATWWESLFSVEDMVEQLCGDGSGDRRASLFCSASGPNSSAPNWLPLICVDPNSRLRHHHYLTEPADLDSVIPGNTMSIRCRIVSGKTHYAQFCISGANKVALDAVLSLLRRQCDDY